MQSILRIALSSHRRTKRRMSACQHRGIVLYSVASRRSHSAKIRTPFRRQIGKMSGTFALVTSPSKKKTGGSKVKPVQFSKSRIGWKASCTAKSKHFCFLLRSQTPLSLLLHPLAVHENSRQGESCTRRMEVSHRGDRSAFQRHMSIILDPTTQARVGVQQACCSSRSYRCAKNRTRCQLETRCFS